MTARMITTAMTAATATATQIRVLFAVRFDIGRAYPAAGARNAAARASPLGRGARGARRHRGHGGVEPFGEIPRVLLVPAHCSLSGQRAQPVDCPRGLEPADRVQRLVRDDGAMVDVALPEMGHCERRQV